MPPQKLLIVDDYADGRAVLTEFFESVGYHVVTAGDATEAVATTTAHRPSVIVMDIFMPGVDGIEATRQLKASGEVADIPVIAYTARPTEHLDDELFVGICAKPCPPDVLLHMVKDAAAGLRGMTYYGSSVGRSLA